MLEDEERLPALCKSKQYEWVRDYVQGLDKEGFRRENLCESVERRYLSDPRFNRANLLRQSPFAARLAEWCASVCKYVRLSRRAGGAWRGAEGRRGEALLSVGMDVVVRGRSRVSLGP